MNFLSVPFFTCFTTLFSILSDCDDKTTTTLNIKITIPISLFCVVGEHNKIFFYPICHFQFTPASPIAPLIFTSFRVKSFFALENIVNVYFLEHRCSEKNHSIICAKEHVCYSQKHFWICYGSNV